MSETIAEELSPGYIREKRIDLTLDPSNTQPSAFQPVLINVSYARTAPQGTMFPLILEVQGPSAESYQKRVFLRVAPGSLIFTPREGGPHKVILREVAHNRWWGSLALDVAGETLHPLQPA
jgi:hypothetical protein